MTRVKKQYTHQSVQHALDWHKIKYNLHTTETGKVRYFVETGIGTRDWSLDQVHAYCYGLADMKRIIEREVSVNG